MLAIGTIASTWSAYVTAHSSACMPPSEPPATAARARDAELLQKGALHPYHVRDGDDWKVRSVRPAGRRVDGRRPRRAAASSQQIRADDEELVGVEGFAGTDHAVPPAEAAALAGIALLGAKAVSRARHDWPGREAGGVRVPAERVAHQDDVVACRREPAVGLVRDANRLQIPAAVERQGLRKVEELRLDRADRAGGGLRR